jgi:hypothetical protein
MKATKSSVKPKVKHRVKAKTMKTDAEKYPAKLVKEVYIMTESFFRCSLNWTGGDDNLDLDDRDVFGNKKRMIKARTVPTEPNGTEVLIIERIDGGSFDSQFLKIFRPKLYKLINKIIDSSNRYAKAHDGEKVPIEKEHVEEMKKFILHPKVDEDYDSGKMKTYKGAVGIKRASGNGTTDRWSYLWETKDADDSFEPIPLLPV